MPKLLFWLTIAVILIGWTLYTARRRAAGSRSAPDTGAVLHALVGPLGVGGGSRGRSGPWTLIVMAQGWRTPGGPVQRQALRLQWPGLSRAELDARRDGIPPWSVVRFRVDALPPATDPDSNPPSTPPANPSANPPANPSAIPTVNGSELMVVEDAELTALAQMLQKPVVVDDPLFGQLTLDRSLDRFEAEASWSDQTVQLSIPAVADTLSEARATAAALWAETDSWSRRLRACAVEFLLPLKNSTWRDEGEDGQLEPLLTEAAFVDRLTIDSIDVEEGGGFSVCFDDGGLFFGHLIEVRGSLDGGCTTAQIMG